MELFVHGKDHEIIKPFSYYSQLDFRQFAGSVERQLKEGHSFLCKLEKIRIKNETKRNYCFWHFRHKIEDIDTNYGVYKFKTNEYVDRLTFFDNNHDLNYNDMFWIIK
jgi:hypothetical protein